MITRVTDYEGVTGSKYKVILNKITHPAQGRMSYFLEHQSKLEFDQFHNFGTP